MRKCAIAVVGLLGLIATPLSATSQSGQVAVHARVPTICTVDVAFERAVQLQAGLNRLGRMVELCNNVEGYRLVLQHPAGITGAAVLLDGRRVPIESSATRTVILDSSHPAYQQRQLAIELAAPVDMASMTIFAEPKGAVY